MTNIEFSNEFDILYNSIATSSAPGIDMYEKSVYLTKAQLEIIKNYYNPKGNKYQEGFEQTEKRRRDLEQLVKDFKTTTFDDFSESVLSSKIGKYSKLVKLPEKLFLIVYESVDFLKCDSGLVTSDTFSTEVKPITHDEYNKKIKNPFKQPGKNKVWRLDLSDKFESLQSSEENFKIVELISKDNFTKYKIRYVEYPKPIILKNLNTEFPEEGLTIDGFAGPIECQLNESIHREILDRAVELALGDYKPQNLQTKMQLNLRNE